MGVHQVEQFVLALRWTTLPFTACARKTAGSCFSNVSAPELQKELGKKFGTRPALKLQQQWEKYSTRLFRLKGDGRRITWPLVHTAFCWTRIKVERKCASFSLSLLLMSLLRFSWWVLTWESKIPLSLKASGLFVLFLFDIACASERKPLTFQVVLKQVPLVLPRPGL